MAASPRPKVTYEEYLDLPCEDVRTELVDGEVVVSPSPLLRHQELVMRLSYLFMDFLVRHGGGRVIADFDMKLSDRNVPRPDLIFVAEARLDVLTRRCVDGVPSLVVEVVSDSRY